MKVQYPRGFMSERGELIDSAAYGELKVLAAKIAKGAAGTELSQPTALLHEAFARAHPHLGRKNLAELGKICAYMATIMRNLLVDQSRKSRASTKITSSVLTGTDQSMDVVDLNDALEGLAGVDPGAAEVAELRLFAGLNLSEIATVSDRGGREVSRDWAAAKAWLKVRMVDQE